MRLDLYSYFVARPGGGYACMSCGTFVGAGRRQGEDMETHVRWHEELNEKLAKLKDPPVPGHMPLVPYPPDGPKLVATLTNGEEGLRIHGQPMQIETIVQNSQGVITKATFVPW